MLYGAVTGGEPGAHFLGIVVEGPHAAAIGDAAGFIDDVEALGPCGVGVVGGVAHIVDAEGDGIVKTLDEIIGDSDALGEGFRLGVANIIFDVGLHFPLVGGMSFAYIHGQEVRVNFIVVENLHHVADVAAERRSSVASENDDERASAGAFADMEMRGAVEGEEAGVGSGVSDFKIAAMHMRQSIAEHEVGVARAARHFGQQSKSAKQQNHNNANGTFPKKRHSQLSRPLNSAFILSLYRARCSTFFLANELPERVANRNTVGRKIE